MDGGQERKRKPQKEMEILPLLIYWTMITQLKSERYLRIYLTARVSDSIITTVNKIIGLATHTIYEARYKLKDKRSDIIRDTGIFWRA